MSGIVTEAGLAVTQSLAANWARLREITTIVAQTSGGPSREVAALQDEMTDYTLLLNDLRHDRHYGDSCILGMYRAPASKDRHHNVEGGLVQHLLQMWELWVDLQRVFRAHNAQHPLLNDAMVWKGILHHDLNKVWKYRQVKRTDGVWEVDYARDTLQDLLGDASNKALYFLMQRRIVLPLPLFNALITSEGGYSRQPRPKAETALAKTLYLLDDMSANVIDRMQTNRFWDSKFGGIINA